MVKDQSLVYYCEILTYETSEWCPIGVPICGVSSLMHNQNAWGSKLSESKYNFRL